MLPHLLKHRLKKHYPTMVLAPAEHLAPTGESFVEVVATIHKVGEHTQIKLFRGVGPTIDDRRIVGVLSDAEAESMLMDAVVSAIRRGVAGEGTTLYWRVEPEFKDRRFYARLLISDKEELEA